MTNLLKLYQVKNLVFYFGASSKVSFFNVNGQESGIFCRKIKKTSKGEKHT